MTDEALMAAYVAGDGKAFVRLFSRLAPAIHGVFLRAFQDKDVANDLTQTTFMKLHRARKGYRDASPVRPWVFSIAARVRIDELRHRYGVREDINEEALAQAVDDRESDRDPGAGEV